jgi:hypothetical protein
MTTHATTSDAITGGAPRRAVTERLIVEVPDAEAGLSLVDELQDLHAELVPIEGARCQVQVELEEGRKRQVVAALEAVERWLADSGIEATRLRLDGRSYTVERPAGAVAAVARAERVGKDDLLFRELNERIGRAAKRASFEAPMLVCECGDADCSETVELTLAEYETIRSRRTHFLIAPSHELTEFARVVEHNDRFAVVEKLGEPDR